MPDFCADVMYLVTSKGSASRVYWAACAECLRSAHAEMPTYVHAHAAPYHSTVLAASTVGSVDRSPPACDTRCQYEVHTFVFRMLPVRASEETVLQNVYNAGHVLPFNFFLQCRSSVAT